VIDRIGNRHPPRLFIREWMTELGFTNRKLAERMERSEGTVSKLLAAADPVNSRGKRTTQKITIEYLAEFADALNIEVPQLFRDPKAPTRDELLKGYSDEELTSAIQLIDHTRAISLQKPSKPLQDGTEAKQKRVVDGGRRRTAS
jgi:transcriptional regulator with XRE-family HTH domain